MPNLFKGTPQGSTSSPHNFLPLKLTPSQYSVAFLEQVGLETLAARYKVVVSDPGTPVGIIEKKLGRGLDWRDRTVVEDQHLRNGWLVLECLPGFNVDQFRARIFSGLPGATLEFCLRLQTHGTGTVAFHQVRGSHSAASDVYIQLEFNSPTRRMMLSHVSSGMSAASAWMAGEEPREIR